MFINVVPAYGFTSNTYHAYYYINNVHEQYTVTKRPLSLPQKTVLLRNLFLQCHLNQWIQQDHQLVLQNQKNLEKQDYLYMQKTHLKDLFIYFFFHCIHGKVVLESGFNIIFILFYRLGTLFDLRLIQISLCLSLGKLSLLILIFILQITKHIKQQ